MNIYETPTRHETFDQPVPCLFLDMNYEASSAGNDIAISATFRLVIVHAAQKYSQPSEIRNSRRLASVRIYILRKLKGHSSPRKRRNETVGCLLLYSHDTSLFVRYRMVRGDDPTLVPSRIAHARFAKRIRSLLKLFRIELQDQ